MKLLDSNILIYTFQPAFSFLRPLLIEPDSAVSEIALIEVLGFHNLSPNEKKYFEILFDNIRIIPIDRSVISIAIELRQQKRISVGDAIGASTALKFNCEFHTRNTDDFKWITRLILINPFI